MDARQFAGGIGVTTVIAVLSAAAIGTLLSGFAVTTFTGATNALGFNASTLASDTTDLYQRVTGGEDDDLVVLSVKETSVPPARRAVCLSERVSPEAANLNLAFSGDGSGAAVVEGQLHGARLKNITYPMLVLSTMADCSGSLKRSSHLAHHPLDEGDELARVLQVPRRKFDVAVLDRLPRTVWLVAEGRPVKDACCTVRQVQ